MNRRSFLAAAAAAASTAGCLSRAADSNDGGPATGSGDETPTGDPGTSNGTPTHTSTPTPGDPPDGDPAVGGECPSFVESADRTVCFGGVIESDVFLEPSRREFVEYEGDDEVETLTFTLHNNGDTSFRLNPHDWAVKRWTGDAWEHVAPQQHVDPLYEIPAGGTYEWVLSTETHAGPMAEDALSVVVGLDPNHTYAFRVHGRVHDEPSGRVECVARFEHLRAVPGR